MADATQADPLVCTEEVKVDAETLAAIDRASVPLMKVALFPAKTCESLFPSGFPGSLQRTSTSGSRGGHALIARTARSARVDSGVI